MTNNEICFRDILENDNKITSFSFFNKIIPYFNRVFKNYSLNSNFIFNMDKIRNIEPIVVPYLVSLGEWCNFKSNCKTIFKISDDIENDDLKQYLSAIGFIDNFKSVFIFEAWGYSSDESTLHSMRSIQKNTKCAVFKVDKVLKDSLNYKTDFSRNDVWAYITPIYYTPSFMSTRDNYFLDNLFNGISWRDFSAEMTRVLAELTHNALFHGHSNCYLLCEYLKNSNLLKISLSDLGIGLRQTIKQESEGYFKFSSQEIKLFKDTEKDECLHSLIESIMLRIWRKNGLFGVVYTVLQNNGTIRIHSEYCQLILSKSAKHFFSKETMIALSNNDSKIKEELLNYLHFEIDKVQQSNVRCTEYFPGVHFEIEMPVPSTFR